MPVVHGPAHHSAAVFSGGFARVLSTSMKGSSFLQLSRRRRRAPRFQAAEGSFEEASCCRRGCCISEPDIKATTEAAGAGHQHAAWCQPCRR